MVRSNNDPPPADDEPPLTDDEIEQFQARLNALKTDVDLLRLQCSNSLTDWMQQAAGENLTKMLVSREDTIDHLRSSDPNLRCVAVHLLSSHWGGWAGLVAQCEDLAFSDPSHDVRKMALNAISLIYANTKDLRIGRQLSEIIRSENWPTSLRIKAFNVLAKIDATASAKQFDNRAILSIVNISEIDWSLIDKYQ